MHFILDKLKLESEALGLFYIITSVFFVMVLIFTVIMYVQEKSGTNTVASATQHAIIRYDFKGTSHTQPVEITADVTANGDLSNIRIVKD